MEITSGFERSRAGARPAPRRGLVGTVAELWRYPVKSMLGEQRRELLVTKRGVMGDRAWALRDPATGRIASAKKHPLLLEFEATYEVDPTTESQGVVRIKAPDGRVFSPDDDGASELVSAFLGCDLRFDDRAGADEKTGINPANVFGDVPVNALKPEWNSETMPDYFQLAAGSFLEIGPIYVLASGSVDHLQDLRGDDGVVDRRRFRPNIYIESLPEWIGFVEDSWLGHVLTVGDEMQCSDFQRTLWCVTSTLAQREIPRDLGILRTLAHHHDGCLGVYATVLNPGVVRVGDEVATPGP
jgi:uncharacterized protein YcbX